MTNALYALHLSVKSNWSLKALL